MQWSEIQTKGAAVLLLAINSIFSVFRWRIIYMKKNITKNEEKKKRAKKVEERENQKIPGQRKKVGSLKGEEDRLCKSWRGKFPYGLKKRSRGTKVERLANSTSLG